MSEFPWKKNKPGVGATQPVIAVKVLRPQICELMTKIVTSKHMMQGQNIAVTSRHVTKNVTSKDVMQGQEVDGLGPGTLRLLHGQGVEKLLQLGQPPRLHQQARDQQGRERREEDDDDEEVDE